MSIYDLKEDEYLIIGKFIHKFSYLESVIEQALLEFSLPSFDQINYKDPKTSSWFLILNLTREHSYSKKVIILESFINTHEENYFLSKEDPLYIGKIELYKNAIKEIKKGLELAWKLNNDRNQLLHSFYFKQKEEFISVKSSINNKKTLESVIYSQTKIKDLCNKVDEAFNNIFNGVRTLAFLRHENMKFIIK